LYFFDDFGILSFFYRRLLIFKEMDLASVDDRPKIKGPV